MFGENVASANVVGVEVSEGHFQEYFTADATKGTRINILMNILNFYYSIWIDFPGVFKIVIFCKLNVLYYYN